LYCRHINIIQYYVYDATNALCLLSVQYTGTAGRAQFSIVPLLCTK